MTNTIPKVVTFHVLHWFRASGSRFRGPLSLKSGTRRGCSSGTTFASHKTVKGSLSPRELDTVGRREARLSRTKSWIKPNPKKRRQHIRQSRPEHEGQSRPDSGPGFQVKVLVRCSGLAGVPEEFTLELQKAFHEQGRRIHLHREMSTTVKN